jgi:hypothetical protein
MNCSPTGDNDNISCFMLNDLKYIAKELNKSGINIPTTNSKQELHNVISNHMEKSNNCKEEICWTGTNIAKQFKDRFIPIMPDKWREKPSEWLNTDDIDNVLNQYAKAYKDFHYTGAVPIDFDLKSKKNYCEVSNICKISIPKLDKKGIKKIGMVFNTDPSTKDGEHWISCVIDIGGINPNELLGRDNNALVAGKKTKKRKRKRKRKSKERNKVKTNEKFYGMYFFDSVADPAPKEVKKLYKRLKEQLKEYNGKDLQFIENDMSHQLGNNECGIYCIYFITNMLKGRSFFNIVEDIKRDKDMHEFRKIYFRNKQKKK